MSHIILPVPTVKEDGAPSREMCIIPLACDVGEVSDGYHTFNELYQHRYLLFCAMSRLAFDLGFRGQREALYCWKSHQHWINGELMPVWDGWFVAGIELNAEMITYHLPLDLWGLFLGIERETPPLHDGHTSLDVIERLKEWLKGGK
jgi:hypothetical protein